MLPEIGRESAPPKLHDLVVRQYFWILNKANCWTGNHEHQLGFLGSCFTAALAAFSKLIHLFWSEVKQSFGIFHLFATEVFVVSVGHHFLPFGNNEGTGFKRQQTPRCCGSGPLRLQLTGFKVLRHSEWMFPVILKINYSRCLKANQDSHLICWIQTTWSNAKCPRFWYDPVHQTTSGRLWLGKTHLSNVKCFILF